MNGFWEQPHTLRTEDVDAGACWRPSAIFRAMQEAAGAQCEVNGLGVRAMQAQHLAWVLNRAHLRMQRLPRLEETVTVRTWPKPHQHFFFPRYYQFWVEGEAIGAAAMLYVQLDTLTRRMAKPWLGDNDELTCELPPPLPTPGSIPQLTASIETFTREARYSDLDINGHVNNTRYLDWFCDCFPAGHHAAFALCDVLIHYNREIVAGESVALSLQTQGDQSVLRGTCEGTPCFALSGRWSAR